ncbi:Cof-type HAD-IIB family hydrolase [Cellvibrio sp. OA-2007]|uniref:Cof-type HAD-IIB family hydrolase n=1 Tax=Cellvibrio sp. OA-2007 TaxID=529823 RepID=UPI000781613C|nr:Cof-type HAD-IIB family hydrolase [Cellvibrio sp. OA-2007]
MFKKSQTPSTFVFDMDGTLLNEHHELSPLTIRALNELRERGNHLVVATGRHFMDIRAYLEQLGGGIPAITCNGAMIHNTAGELIQRVCLPLAVNENLLPLGEQCGVHLNMYTDSEWLVNAPCESMLDAHAQSQFFYRQIALQEMLTTPALKILFYGENAKLQQLKTQILASLRVPIHLTFSDEYYLEAMPNNISKGDALKTLAENLDIPLANSMAFGDGFNDVELFNAVTHPVVMDNASEKLKQLFPGALRATANHQDGVAGFLYEHVL